MIRKLHKTQSISDNIEPVKGERKVLCSNETNGRSPFLGPNKKANALSDNELLKYLAELLVDMYVSEIHERKQ